MAMCCSKRGEAMANRACCGPMRFAWSSEKANRAKQARRKRPKRWRRERWNGPTRRVAKTKLQADKLVLDFASSGKARQLQAIGNVQTERAVSGRPVQTATARNGIAELQPTGGWLQMDLDGDVKLKEGERSGQATHAVFVRAS